MNTPGLLLMMLTGAAFLLGVCLLGYALHTHNRPLLRGVAAAGAVWAAGYVALLLFSSLTSRPQELGLHERKAFCGFYLDCHLGVSVEEVVQAKALNLPDGLQTTSGLFYLVTVRASSDARRATLRLTDPEAVLIDAQGRTYRRSYEVERALEAAGGAEISFMQALGPNASTIITKTLVFELPGDAEDPRLLVTEGHWAGRLLELFLIGDEDSLLHEKTLFRIARPGAGARLEARSQARSPSAGTAPYVPRRSS